MTVAFRFDATAIDAIFADHDHADQPGVAVGIAHRSRPLYRRGFGVASIEQPVALSPSTRMRIASITKHFCCLVVMLLVEEGRLSPHDRVRRHIDELPAWADDITLAHLMSHTSGMRCPIDLLIGTCGALGRLVTSEEQLRLSCRVDSVNFAPGTFFTYNNGAYLLLCEVVRRVTGRPFDDVLQDRVLKPAGLVDTAMRPSDFDLVARAATSHVTRPDRGWDRGVFGPEMHGEGGLVSTIDDLLRWLAQWRHPVVGSAKTWDALSRPRTVANGTSTGYGFGLMRSRHRGVEVVHHSGALVGVTAQLLQAPEHELDVVVMANRSGVDAIGLVDRVLDACLEGLAPASRPASRDALPVGDFHSKATGRVVRVVVDEDHLAVDLGFTKAMLFAEGDGRHRYRANPAAGATLERASDGRLVHVEFGEVEQLDRAMASDGSMPSGPYANAPLDVSAVIDDATLSMRSPFGRIDYALEAIGPGLWLARSDAGALPRFASLERDGDDLLFTTQRTHRLRLARTR